MSISVTLSALMAFGASITNAGSLYLGRRDWVPWQTAKNRCADFGGNLATWSNSNDWNAIKSVVAQLGSSSFVGIDDINEEGKWRMIDEDTDYCAPQANNPKPDCDDIDEWNPGEPNDYATGEDCAEMYSNGKLNDITCTDSRYYVCEFDTDNFKAQSSDLEVPDLPWIGAEPVPQRFVYGTYSAQDLMVVALAVFLVFNVVTLAVFCLRTKGTAATRYAKVVADSDEDCRLNA